MTQPLYSYLLSHTREPAHLLRLRERTAEFAGPRARNAVSPEQGSFLRWLVASLGARRALEVGVFTGYSSVAIASALPPASEGGLLLALERDPRPLDLARRAWAEAGVDDRVQPRVGDAKETLAELVAALEAWEASEGKAEAASAAEGGRRRVRPSSPFSYDFAFIDADKRGYGSYYESCLRLVRPGGVIAIDNVLWYGRVTEPDEEEEDEEEEEEQEEDEGEDEEVEGKERGEGAQAATVEAGGDAASAPEQRQQSLPLRVSSAEERLPAAAAAAPEGVQRQQKRRRKKRDRRWVASQKAATQAIRDLNASLLKDERIDLSIIPVGDGIALCRKR